jgi:hypothetical protein
MILLETLSGKMIPLGNLSGKMILFAYLSEEMAAHHHQVLETVVQWNFLLVTYCQNFSMVIQKEVDLMVMELVMMNLPPLMDFP